MQAFLVNLKIGSLLRFFLSQKIIPSRDGKMAEWVKVLAFRYDSLRLVPGTHTGNGEKRFLQVVF